jgi:putative peptidoglycan lipid II flippase
VVRVVLGAGLGYLGAMRLGIGVAGLTLGSGVAGWVEFLLLRRTLNQRIGSTGLPAGLVVRLWGAAVVAAGAGWAVKLVVGLDSPIPDAAAILGVYGVVYFGLTYAFAVDECRRLLERVRR